MLQMFQKETGPRNGSDIHIRKKPPLLFRDARKQALNVTPDPPVDVEKPEPPYAGNLHRGQDDTEGKEEQHR